MTSLSAFTWLVHSAVASTILLALGALAVSLSRQPADRLRLIQCSFVATLFSLVLFFIPSFSAVSLGFLGSRDTPLPSLSVPAAADVSEPEASSSNRSPTVSPRTMLVEMANAQEHPQSPSAHETIRVAVSPNEANGAPIDFIALAIRGACVVYAVGMMIFLIRWARARARLAQLLRSAREVPPAVRAEFSRIAGADLKQIGLFASAEVDGPITWGVRQPVIVIPTSVLEEHDPVRLRYYLAHEWAHVVRRDFATWQLATLLQSLLYYQPLFWWLRRRLAICMDQLADADASDQGSSTVDYADFLVQLARLRLAPNPQLSLGIGDKRSSLQQRVVFLLGAVSRPRPTCPRTRSLVIGTAALSLAAFVSLVRLDAQTAANADTKQANTAKKDASQEVASKPEEQKEHTEKAEAKDKPGSVTYDGTVIDADTGKPIQGVKVSVLHKLSNDPKTRDWSLIETTEHETDAEGHYRFVIPPEQANQYSLYIEVEAHHPNYAAQGRSGYSHSMIRKNLKMGEPPFFSQIKLWPGEAVTGKIVNPEGEPLTGVEVSMYSASDKSKKAFRGAFDETRTDAKGVFRLVPPTPGDGVLWIKPEQHSPQAHRLGARRGDWGTIAVEKGPAIVGRVVDVQGAAVPGVKVEARRSGDGEKADEFLRTNAVANQIGRKTVSGPQGEFTLASLPDGKYTLTVESNSDSYDRPPLPQVFVPETVSIADGAAPESVEIRAAPHVLIKGTYLNSAGKPRSGHEVRMFGYVDSSFFYTRSTSPHEDGKFEIRAPHGVQKVELDLSTNEHSALRWRLKPDEPLKRGRRIKLDTIEDDISGLEVVRYTAPILLVKPVDEHGAVVEGCQPLLKYQRNDAGDEQLTVYTTGSHVSFEEQRDGRWRTEQLLPDEPITVEIKKNGYNTTPQELSLAEGDEREIVFVMKKDSAAAQAAETPEGE